MALRPRRGLCGLFVAAACGGDDGDSGGDSASGGGSTEVPELRLGYFPNVTHAPAVAAVQEGFFESALDGTATIAYSTFDSGTEAGEALLAEGLDATFIGPNPAINAFAQTDGEAVRIVSGTTSGGAALVVNPDIQAVEDLEGHTIATPSLGNTQDVALRAFLTEEGFDDDAGGGDVPRQPRTTPTRWPPSRTARWTAVGCPSPGPPGWCRRVAVRSWSTRPTSGPTVSS